MVSTRSKGTGGDDGTAVAGTKRKEHATSPKSKHDPKAAKKQITIEESLSENSGEVGRPDSEMQDAAEETSRGEVEQKEDESQESNQLADDEQKSQDTRDPLKEKPSKEKETPNNVGKEKVGDDAVEESSQREKNMASNILEKGVIYFFTRNRVGIDDAESVGDLQRTHFALRPLPQGAKLVDGALPDLKNNRLLALPKKAFPKSHSDRFMAFVERSNATIQDLKDGFFQGSEYETKTSGTRQNQPVTPVGEGVYMITRTEDRSTHLVYAITIPTELGEVQEDLGLRAQGSFVISVKNPERPGPASTRLPQGPDFPKEIIEEFRGLAWSEVKPNYLDYENCQILLIGEKPESATEPTTKDQKHDKTTPMEEIEQLEHEDELRIEHLHGNDSVFDDLKISQTEYSKVPTTW